jgi:hypothetical protein
MTSWNELRRPPPVTGRESGCASSARPYGSRALQMTSTSGIFESQKDDLVWRNQPMVAKSNALKARVFRTEWGLDMTYRYQMPSWGTKSVVFIPCIFDTQRRTMLCCWQCPLENANNSVTVVKIVVFRQGRALSTSQRWAWTDNPSCVNVVRGGSIVLCWCMKSTAPIVSTARQNPHRQALVRLYAKQW